MGKGGYFELYCLEEWCSQCEHLGDGVMILCIADYLLLVWAQKVWTIQHARCSGGWLFAGNKSHHAAELMLKTAQSCATWWAAGHQWLIGCTKGHGLTLNPCITLLPTVNKYCVRLAINGFRRCIALASDNTCRLNMDYTSYWFPIPISTGLLDLMWWYVETDINGKWMPCTL